MWDFFEKNEYVMKIDEVKDMYNNGNWIMDIG